MKNAAVKPAAARWKLAPPHLLSLPPYCPAFFFVVNILPFYGRRALIKFAQCDCGKIRMRPRASGMLLIVNPGLRNSCISPEIRCCVHFPVRWQYPRRTPRRASTGLVLPNRASRLFCPARGF
ncbi:hypothetical protein [Paraburkholderia kururiensis]|uniref:hypothetical protein n=1 Tax=Paraburkholderia kururiensis TaxID=984307 RepID=UPI001470471C|nr:hypothetical protein [Paraburkholderia kururiensis]